MGCAFGVVFAMLARLFVLFAWLARPNLFTAVFGDSWLIPLLGILFLPLTTFMYVIVWSATGLTAADWLWVGLAFLLDVANYASAGYQGRDQIPGYSGD